MIEIEGENKQELLNSVIYKLNQHKIHCNEVYKLIEIPRSVAVGIKLWGMIDFLKKHGWTWTKTNK